MDSNKIDYKTSQYGVLGLLLGIGILMFPILDQYAGISSHVSLGEIFLILIIFFVFVMMIKQNIPIKMSHVSKKYIAFLAVELLVSAFTGLFIDGFSYESMILLWGRMLLYAVFVIISGKYSFNHELLIKMYSFICCFLCLYLLYQYIGHYIFGKIISNYISFLSIKSSLLDYATRDMGYVYSVSFRPSSLFSEPAKLAQYLTPCLVLLLFKKDMNQMKHHWIIVGIITAGIVLSTSFLGIIICGIVFFIYLMSGKVSREKLVFFIAAFIAFTIVYYKTDLITRNISRVNSGLTTSSGTSSAALRLLRGWEIFYKLPLFNKLFGVGLYGIASFLKVTGLTIKYGGNYSYGEYCSTITYVINCCGIVGLIPFAGFLSTCFKSSDLSGKVLTVVIVLMGFGSSFLVTPTWVLYFAIILSCSNDEHGKIEKVSEI